MCIYVFGQMYGIVYFSHAYMKQSLNILVKATLQRIKIHTLPWMSQEVDGSMVRISGLFHLLKNGVYLGFSFVSQIWMDGFF